MLWTMEGAMETAVGAGNVVVVARTGESDQEWCEVVGALLREQRRVLQAPPAASEALPDPMDEAREREEEALWLAVLDRSRDMQVTVEEALHRLATGGYGLCAECGQHIALARLRALPFAVRCLACQERLERENEAAARRSAGRANLGSRYDERPPDSTRRSSRRP